MSVSEKVQPFESAEDKKGRILPPEKKYQIFLEAQKGQIPVGEILRREVLYSTDLARIQQKVQEGALERLPLFFFRVPHPAIRCSHGPKRASGHHNGRSVAPERKELAGPNQRWCWDISYLRAYERGVFLYLYLLLDEYSRKVIDWRISWHLKAQEARLLLEEGLASEIILDYPVEGRPEVVNDRGRQMKAASVKQVFELHGMPQLFASPRTPKR